MNLITKFSRLQLALLAMATTMIMTAQERKLPAPSRDGGRPMNEVVAHRHSVRDFDSSREISDSTLGQ